MMVLNRLDALKDKLKGIEETRGKSGRKWYSMLISTVAQE